METPVGKLVLCAPLIAILLLSASPLLGGLETPDDAFDGSGPWMVRAWFGDDTMRREVASWGDHYRYHRDKGFLSIEADVARTTALRALGFFVEVDEELTSWIRHAEAAQLEASERAARGEAPEAGIPGFPCYRTVEETFAAAQALAAAHPTLATVVDIGDSWEKVTSGGNPGYDLLVIRLTNSGVAGPKPRLFAHGAIHAREYTTAELVTRFAEELVQGYGVDADATWLLDQHEIHLLLQTNPDGRKQAETGILWRKNVDNNYCANTSSRGADLNRNFSFQWNCCGGSDSDPCGETYRGSGPGSEPEVQAVQSYLQANFPAQRIAGFPGGASPADATGVYLDIHSFSQLVLWPWGGTGTPTDNATALTTLGRRFAYINGYLPEQSIGLYATDGTTVDFAYGDRGVAAYTFELGTDFFQACSTFENAILPANLQALRYAARVVRTPYMTPAGPEALAVTVLPGVIAPGDPVNVTATLDDTRFSNANGTEPTQAIAAAEVAMEPPASATLLVDGFESGDTNHWAVTAWPIAMTADDGAFDETIEAASAALNTSTFSSGRHLLYVRGRDAAGNWGPVSAAFLTVIDPATSPVVEGSVVEAGSGTPLAATVDVGPYVTNTDPGTGAYSIQVPEGTYDLTATATDHAPQTVAGVTLIAQQTFVQDFTLMVFANVFTDDAEAGNAGWTAQAPWAITTSASHSPTHSWTDSPGGSYLDNVNTAVTSPAIDLSAATGVELSFWQRYATEATYDYCHVEVSADNGATWIELAAYDGTQATWTRAVFLVPQLDGAAQAKVRFRLTSDGFVTDDGCYVDDVVVRAAIPP